MHEKERVEARERFSAVLETLAGLPASPHADKTAWLVSHSYCHQLLATVTSKLFAADIFRRGWKCISSSIKAARCGNMPLNAVRTTTCLWGEEHRGGKLPPTGCTGNAVVERVSWYNWSLHNVQI